MPRENIICVSQHALAARTVEVASAVLEVVAGNRVQGIQEGSPHIAYADSVTAQIPEEIQDELEESYSVLLRSIEDGGYFSV